MILFIDTSNFESLHLALIDSEVKSFKTSVAFNENYKTNQLLADFLQQEKITPQDLTQIIVCSGPGSFTGIRVGVALAQALSFALQIPAHTITEADIPQDLLQIKNASLNELGAQNQLNYGQEPNITKPK
ncbi:MAG: tRNA (adenosine(37)-N6)-threonylcarbamoyltransferase complex dimerization subunit type 1 TsaB [Candidatus Doudnabacteria bacterium]